MPIISCPDCGANVSRLAPACPKCGRPLKATVIEQTGKGWKAVQLVGSLLIVGAASVAIACFTVTTPDKSGGLMLGSLLTLVAGLPLYAIGRVGAWWFHG